MSSVSPKPVVVTIAALPVLPSISALVMSVVACTIGAAMSDGCTPALASNWVTPARTPLSGRDGVDNVLSTTTRPLSASSRTTSVNVPPMSTARRQSAIAVLLPHGMEDVEDPHFVVVGGVAAEEAVTVGHVLRRPVDVAGPEHRALVGADAEVELPGDDQTELLVLRVPVVRRRTDAVLDAPERERHLVAVVDTAVHAGRGLFVGALVVGPDLGDVAAHCLSFRSSGRSSTPPPG